LTDLDPAAAQDAPIAKETVEILFPPEQIEEENLSSEESEVEEAPPEVTQPPPPLI